MRWGSFELWMVKHPIRSMFAISLCTTAINRFTGSWRKPLLWLMLIYACSYIIRSAFELRAELKAIKKAN